MNPIALHAANPGPMTGTGNWTWLIPGRVPTLIDAGVGETPHLAALDEALGGAALRQVLVTHAHSDHAAGASAIAARTPGVRFRKMPWPARDSRWPVRWERLADGDRIEAGDEHLTVVHTPGHAPDHLCFWHAETRTLFGGDLVIEGTTVYIPASLQGDLAASLASLERVLALVPARILPAHGSAIDDPVRLLREYLEHRREREAQILDALRHGAHDPDAIVARETVIAHLEKLEHERRAARRGDVWTIINGD
ncbi:MAG: MBL fold metallo-hydrolase [Acidobacteria bacterium]|nr:MBL fold metallo-hydrolase [Acidobacteriota bacterium]